MSVNDVKKLKVLEAENQKLKRLAIDQASSGTQGDLVKN